MLLSRWHWRARIPSLLRSIDHPVYIYCLIHSADCTNYSERCHLLERMSLHVIQLFVMLCIEFLFLRLFCWASEAAQSPHLTFSLFGLVNDFFCEKILHIVTAFSFIFIPQERLWKSTCGGCSYARPRLPSWPKASTSWASPRSRGCDLNHVTFPVSHHRPTWIYTVNQIKPEWLYRVLVLILIFLHCYVRTDIQSLSDGPVRAALLIVYSSDVTPPRTSASSEMDATPLTVINLKNAALLLVKPYIQLWKVI